MYTLVHLSSAKHAGLVLIICTENTHLK